jgi:putative ABC transport system substrate-binding protein
MNRRAFLAALGGAAAWPLAARAQQAGKLPTIGVLGSNATVWSPWTAAFERRMRQLGWVEGQTVAIEYRWAEGRHDRDTEIAAEFVGRKVAVIVATAPAVPTVMQATAAIPIVFVLAGDPVGAGYVASLARPGGNVTGLSLQQTDTVGKRLQLLREVVPRLRQLAIMGNVGYPDPAQEMNEVQATAQTIAIDVLRLEIRRAEDIGAAFATLKGPDALYVVGDPLLGVNRTRLITHTLAARLPTIFWARERVQAGGLMSYGPDYADQFRRVADFVDKILRGTRPGNIPVEQPTKFELVINLTTAKALGLTMPPTLLATADEVIE